MSKVKPNNLEKALAEAEAFNEEVVKFIPTEIKESDKGLYHVALIKLTHKEHLKKYEVSVNVQPLNDRQMSKLAQKKVQSIDYDKAIIVHMPEAVEEINVVKAKKEEDSDVLDIEAIKQKAKDEARAELEAELKAKEEANSPKKVNVKNFNKEKLIEFALENSIEIEGAETNKEIIEKIVAWQEA